MPRMFDRMARGELALGTLMPAHGEEWVETLGYAGLDFINIDMMVTPLDWSDVAGMVRAAHRYDMTPWVRLSAYPWSSDGVDEFDTSLPARVLRALSLGAECVLASVNGAHQVERILHPLTNPHRRFWVYQGSADETEAQRRLDEAEPPQRVVPIIESMSAIEQAAEMLAVPGLHMVYLGMGDVCRELGHPGDDQHPAVREAVRHVVEAANQHDVIVTANTLGLRPGGDLSGLITEGVQSLWELGVRGVLIPRPTVVVQRFYEATLRGIEGRMPGARG